ncbi:uncharacterized protein LOC120181374 [Hibiscus syriacus]|uniref:uncharacterized protein LOC120181374 n=1 Tax=Hibiscus syriacus TaxID=106335 RepID=UPI001921BE8B|nr:uncharacterized protein LOC120181374 [Hibiscus syriacus]
MRKWVPGMIPYMISLASISIWVKLWNVPLELYSQDGLRYIVSALGRPLYTDHASALKHQFEFAKICINIDAKVTLPSFVMVELDESNRVVGVVELVWAPSRYGHCNIFGHLENDCSKRKISTMVATCHVVDPMTTLGEDDSSCNVDNMDVAAKGKQVAESVEGVTTCPVVDLMETLGENEGVGCVVSGSGGVLDGDGGLVHSPNQFSLLSDALGVVVSHRKTRAAADGGCNDPVKLRRVLGLVRKLKVEILYLLGTRIREVNVGAIVQ